MGGFRVVRYSRQSARSRPILSPMPDPRSLLPHVPLLVAGAGTALWLDADGTVETLSPKDALGRARQGPPMVCHTPALARRLGGDPFPAYDVLELFAFTRPAQCCLPTPRGLAAGRDPTLERGVPALVSRLVAARQGARAHRIATSQRTYTTPGGVHSRVEAWHLPRLVAIMGLFSAIMSRARETAGSCPRGRGSVAPFSKGERQKEAKC